MPQLGNPIRWPHQVIQSGDPIRWLTDPSCPCPAPPRSYPGGSTPSMHPGPGRGYRAFDDRASTWSRHPYVDN